MKDTEENLLLLRRVSGGDRSAENDFVRRNMGLVISIAGRFAGRGQEYEDLIQIGCIGLLHAARTFDMTKGTAFSSFAVPHIAGEIKRCLRDDGLIKVSRAAKKQCRDLMRMQEKLSHQNGMEPTLGEVCRACGIREEEAVYALDACAGVSSLDEEIGDGDGTRLGDLCADERQTDAAKRVIFREAIESLDGRERAVICLRGIYGLTQTQTAGRLGLTQATVSRTETKAKEKIMAALIP